MLYLLDANILITGARLYPLETNPKFWKWLYEQANAGRIKIPTEQFEEVTGKSELVTWLKENKNTLLPKEELNTDMLTLVRQEGYDYDVSPFNEVDLGKLGKDPQLISYALIAERNLTLWQRNGTLVESRTNPQNAKKKRGWAGYRTIVTLEKSAPSRTSANRKIPDVCGKLGVPCCNLDEMNASLGFDTKQQPATA